MSDRKPDPMPLALAGADRPGHRRSDASSTATATWQAIDRALRPVLGGRGVDALYWRSLHLAAGSHPWLLAGDEAAEAGMDLVVLATALDGQDAAEAESGSRALLDHFRELLVSLVGASLTARLLVSVPELTIDAQNPQDPPT